MTITLTPPRPIRLKFALIGVVFALTCASFTQGADSLAANNVTVQTRPQTTESSLIFNSTPFKNLIPVFPVMGLIAAAWATYHVRRRNARQLAATR